MGWQRYVHQQALDRMAEGRCPECGRPPEEHDGLGGPVGCTLSDTGVAGRIYQFEQDRPREEGVH